MKTKTALIGVKQDGTPALYELQEPKTKTLEEQNPFLAYFRKRIKHNKNCIIAIVGETGSGKSYASLRLAEQLDPKFNVNRIAFKAEEFLNLLEQDLPSGSAIVFDESGVAWQSRNFMSFMNKALSYALQTVRFKNHYLILTVPDLSFIDAQGRKLLHMLMVTQRILRKKKVVRIRPYIYSMNYRQARDPFTITPKVVIGDKIIKIRDIEVGMPSLKLRRRYEDRKLKYINALYSAARDELDGGKAKEFPLSDKHRIFFELDKAGLTTLQIAKQMGIGLTRGYSMRQELRAKGYDKEKIPKS